MTIKEKDIPEADAGWRKRFVQDYNSDYLYVNESIIYVRKALLADLGNVAITDGGHYAFAPLNEEMTEWRAADGVVYQAEGLLDFLWNHLDSGTIDAFCNWEPEDFESDFMTTLDKEAQRRPLNYLQGLGS